MVDYSGAFCLGMFFSSVFIYFILVFIKITDQTRLKHFLSECDDKAKESFKKELDEILAHYKNIIQTTNLALFKRKANSFIELIHSLEKYRLN